MKKLLFLIGLFIFCSQAEAKFTVQLKNLDRYGVSVSSDLNIACADDNTLVYDTGTATWACGAGGGTGTMTTVKTNDTQVGGADIVTLDFGLGFDVTEAPDTEQNISMDLSEVVTGDIGFSVTNVATISPDSVALTTDTTGNYATSNAEGGPATNILDDLIVKADFADEDWGDASIATNVFSLDADVVSNDEIAPKAVSTDQLEAINIPTDGQVYSYDAATFKGEWVTSSGTGDITDVFACTTGNCNALTAAAGDSLNMAAGDTSDPFTETTSAGGTAEGQAHWETDRDRFTVGTGTKALEPGVFILAGSFPGAAATRYGTPWSSTVNATATNIDTMKSTGQWICDGFHVEVNAAPGAGQSWTMSLYIDAGASAKSCSIADTAVSCDDDSDDLTITDGQTLQFEALRVGTAANPGEVSFTTTCRNN